jgi:hypothetical protein
MKTDLRARRAAVALSAMAIAVAGVGCGGDDSSDAETRSKNRATVTTEAALPNLVSQEDVASAPSDSPQRALLEWFQAVQFQDVEGAELLTEAGVIEETGPKRVKAAIGLVGPALGKPSIVNVRREGDRAAVRTLIEAFAPGRKAPVSTDPESFELTNTASSWELSNLDYLLMSARAIRRATR